MNEYVASAIIFLLFLIPSLYFRRAMVRVGSPWRVVLYLIIYIILLDGYFEGINTLHEILINHGFYIEFGHASLLLLEVFAICLIAAIILIISIIIQRLINKKNSNIPVGES